MLNKKHANRNRGSKNSTRSLRGSLRGILEVETVEEEAASEAGAEAEDSEADASRCLIWRFQLQCVMQYCELAWRWWYGISTMDCICIFYFPPGDQTDQDRILPEVMDASCVADEHSDRAHPIREVTTFWNRALRFVLVEALIACCASKPYN
jgi:hypothetical protein